MYTRSKQNLMRLLISSLLIAGILLSSTGLTNRALDVFGLEKLSQSNDRYLASSFKRALQTFGILSVVKVGLAIVEGTEVGVGFGLQVGDAVQAAYDYVDIAWRTVLASSAVLLGTRYLLETADLVDQWFLVVTLLLVYLTLLSKWFVPKFPKVRRTFQDVSFLMAIFTITLYIILPLSIAGGRFLSNRITAPSVKEAESGFYQFKSDLFPEDRKEDSGLWSKITGAKDRLKRITVYLSDKTTALSMWVLKIIAGYIFDCLVFPLLLFVFLFWITRLAIRYFFDVKRDRILKEDLEAILAKYYLRSNVS